jgi:hypothetical protein
MFSARRIASNRLLQQELRFFGQHNTGMLGYKFDYFFESKIDHGHFPNWRTDFRKILGEDYNVNS